jgi:hypothetical protein
MELAPSSLYLLLFTRSTLWKVFNLAKRKITMTYLRQLVVHCQKVLVFFILSHHFLTVALILIFITKIGPFSKLTQISITSSPKIWLKWFLFNVFPHSVENIKIFQAISDILQLGKCPFFTVGV